MKGMYEMNYNLSDTAIKINDYVLSLLPDKLKAVAKNYLSAYPGISEIRLHSGAPTVFNNRGQSLVSKIKCEQSDIDYTVSRLTESNYMKYEEIMRDGYITLKNGCRAGVAGDVFVSDGKIKLLKKVTHINIRLPAVLSVRCPDVIEYLEKNNFSSSVLVVSSPGIGKTTLLRSLAYTLSSHPYNKRVSVVDTNRELFNPFADGSSICDFLEGYPKPEGIAIATKYFSPEYIICDELGEMAETQAILEVSHTGVPLIASAHGESFSDVFRRKNLKILIKSGVFDAVVRLTRRETKIVSELKKVADILEK